jgi:AraC-like DNA-binding protein
MVSSSRENGHHIQRALRRQKLALAIIRSAFGSVLVGVISVTLDTRYLNRFRALVRQHGVSSFIASLALIDQHGAIVEGQHPCPSCSDDMTYTAHLGQESLRWGDAFITMCPHGIYLWSIPVTDNNELIGSILSGANTPNDQSQVTQFTQSARHLLHLACKHNLTNAALLRCHAEEAAREADKAQAIHSLKGERYTSVREVYLREEANLISSIKTNEVGQAREILNVILTEVYALGGQDFELLKALVLELVVVMYRTAVEAGGDPVELLGLNYASIQEYATISDEETLTPWLVQHLERLMAAIRNSDERPVEVQLQLALRYMQEHLAEPISRDDVAAAALMSSSHLAHLLRAKLNRSYTELLSEMRINAARQLLVRTCKSLAQIAAETGFSDQSYFTKVFKQQVHMTPGEYRRLHSE